ncbi:sodium:solute symporter family protein [Psychrobacter lutiphocae]|uniref:sodium:solute symporter family protein n=1 Tax=Psychrobacter lutiphocae TaxID=540500 RepID=UPI000377D3A2|nr:sodium:solute symporter family protein [Psychrobacter lutiphocae]
MNNTMIIVGITIVYLISILFVGIRARGNSASSLEGYVAGGRHMGVLVLFFILGAEIFSAFAFLGTPGWSYKNGAPALYILAYLALVPIVIWTMGPRVSELGRKHGYLTQGDMISHHFNSKALGMLAGVIGIVALVPYLTIQIAGAGMLFEAATDGFVPYWLGSLLAFFVVAAYVFTSGLSGIGWTNLVQGVMMIVIAWFLGLAIPKILYGGVGEMFLKLQEQAPEFLTMPGANGMNWGYFSTAILISAFGSAMWPHLFMKFYATDSGKSLRKVSVFYPLYAYLLVPLLFIGFAGILVFKDAPLERADTILLEMVINVVELSPWIIGLMLSGALAAAMSTGANLAHTSAVILVEDILKPFCFKNISEKANVNAIRGSVIVLSAISYLLALLNISSLVIILLTAYGIIVQMFPMVIGALFMPQLRRQSVMAGALLGTLLFILMQFNLLGLSSPFGWHAGIWSLLFNIIIVIAFQKFGTKPVAKLPVIPEASV